MYVANLDRPWIETPFLFQGFEISTEEELEQLRRLCKVVYVELSGPEEPDPPRTAAAPPLAPPQAAARDAAPRRKDPVPLKTELAAAREIHTEAKRVVNGMIDELRRGGRMNAGLLGIVVDSMVESVCRNREAITWLARMKSKDDYVYNHSLASSVWALVLGRHLGFDKATLRALSLGAMLFDVGKTRVPTELLRKPGELSPGERTEVRRHVEYGLDILRETPGVDSRVVTMVAAHHERLDGSGYPLGLRGDSIPLLGGIAGIIDCYDAMTSARSYAKPLSTYDAVR